MDSLKDLNSQQKEAVLHINGPLLVIAGAGAGKTKVITHRIANLIEIGISPDKILAVTFTNKAADEMKQRIHKLISNFEFRISNLPTVGTFHSICARILRENSRSVNLPRSFSILDKEDSLKIIKKCLKTLNINPKQFQPAKIQAIISREKANLTKQEDFAKNAGEDFFPAAIAAVWEEYEKNLIKQKSCDFDDLIAKTVFLFQKKPDILKKYQNKWQYILIDEYQDTNHSQYVLAKVLSQKSKNICVVGDEDQSIYQFRGADFGNILNFEKDWPNVKTIILEQNYRSTQKILAAANAIIRQNKFRKSKNLFSMLEKGPNLTIFDASNEKEEAQFVAAASQKLIASGLNPSEIAVLYRANFQSRILEEYFLANEIPYQVVGTRFFERKEIKDIITYIKAALNPNDILSLERIINEPPRGLGKTSLINHLSKKKLAADKQQRIKEFFEFLEKIKKTLNQKTLSVSILYIIKESGYQNHLNNGSEEGMMRMDNLKELLMLTSKYNGLKPLLATEKFLEDMSLMSEQDALKESKNRVRLMTVHAAKGLEFQNVFLAGLEEGLFPYIQSLRTDKTEEERRLFYVAVTRAKKKLFLSFAYSRNLFNGRQINKPSRFINEIPAELFSAFGGENLPTTNYLEI